MLAPGIIDPRGNTLMGSSTVFAPELRSARAHGRGQTQGTSVSSVEPG
jgi:hypothetical protein